MLAAGASLYLATIAAAERELPARPGERAALMKALPQQADDGEPQASATTTRIEVAGYRALSATTRIEAAGHQAVSASTRIEATSYRAFAHRELMRSLAGLPGRVDASLAGRHRDIELRAGDVELKARLSSDRVQPRMVVWVDVFVDGRIERSIPVSFDVRWLRPALVTRDRMAAKVTLNEQRVALMEIDVARSHGDALVDRSQLTGKRLRRELPANTVIGTDDIEDLPPVVAGDKVDVYAKVGGVVVRTVGIAQRDGFAGDRVNVRLEKDRQTLRVQVLGPNRTAVIENANTRM
jgi:flagella basal body P-ring formation protein FlgA